MTVSALERHLSEATEEVVTLMPAVMVALANADIMPSAELAAALLIVAAQVATNEPPGADREAWLAVCGRAWSFNESLPPIVAGKGWGDDG